jgi:hypothetical protein
VGTEVASERDQLTERERQILEHLEQAQSLGVPLTEYASASAYDVDVRDLSAGKAQLVKKCILARQSALEKGDLVPVRVTTARGSAVYRLTRPSGWVHLYCFRLDAIDCYLNSVCARSACCQASLASAGNDWARSLACAEAAVPRTTRPLIPWKIAASRKKLNAR